VTADGMGTRLLRRGRQRTPTRQERLREIDRTLPCWSVTKAREPRADGVSSVSDRLHDEMRAPPGVVSKGIKASKRQEDQRRNERDETADADPRGPGCTIKQRREDDQCGNEQNGLATSSFQASVNLPRPA